MTQGELAGLIGVERNTVSRWENGGMLPKDPAVVARIASALQVTSDWLISGDQPEATARALGEGAGTRYPLLSSTRLPGRAGVLADGYLGRLGAAGCSDAQMRGAEALLVEGARNRVAASAFEDRTEDAVCADVDAAWDMIVQILRRDGIRP